MKWFQSNPKDERVEQAKNQIYRELYIVVAVLCFLSIIIKQFVNVAVYSSITAEIAILLITSLYYMVRGWQLDIFSAEREMHDRRSRIPMTAKNFIYAGIGGVAISLYFGMRSAVLYAEGTGQTIYYFFLVAAGCLMIYIPLLIGLAFLVEVFTKSRHAE
ncbi:DUF6773 family protein [Marinococcus sp. PL1-022]|uniref:DUF6773 family protein n=1 Tax=Marinococcus sp. PL1-022 TaxID=3095363 RepID=UPI0029C21E43|nr:DUF6773 family protein [Marinococcus sp. PL1-022]MDX6152740.1 DUF6773 family protein [Marinococcus sp. PL1-022]